MAGDVLPPARRGNYVVITSEPVRGPVPSTRGLRGAQVVLCRPRWFSLALVPACRRLRGHVRIHLGVSRPLCPRCPQACRSSRGAGVNAALAYALAQSTPSTGLRTGRGLGLDALPRLVVC